MKKEIRTQEIQDIIKRNEKNPFGKQELPWEDDLKTMKVYKIPLHLLVYNKYNGRILSRTKSLEKQKHNIDAETDEGRKCIETLLWDSKPDRNKKTQESLAKYGQEKVGIITRDGIIIDGNRRAMLLNRIKKYDYFKAVVLPVTLDENPLEIEKLETSFQMGEDEKLGYNATEKYLKSKGLYLRLTNSSKISIDKLDESALNKISDWMGETKGEIKKYLSTMGMMDEYLEYLEYDGIYTQLDGREDQFLSLTKWLETFYGENSKKAFDGYKDEDVDDLKVIAFDYLRVRSQYDGKEFRNLAEGNKEKHFFGDKEIWNSFSDKHFKIIENLPEEANIDFNSNNLARHLNDRDKLFFNSAKSEKGESLFIENLTDHKYRIGYNKASGEPEKLVKRATQTFEAIKTNHKSFATPEVQILVKDLGDKVFKSLQKKSPSYVLSQVIELLESINIKNIPDVEKEDIKVKTKQIQSIGYRINKKL